MSLRVRLLALFSLVAVAGLAGFLALWLLGIPALGIEGMFTQEIRRATTSTEVLADKERDTYEHWFAEHRRALTRWSQSPELSRLVENTATVTPGAAQRARTTLARRLSSFKEITPGTYLRLYIVARDGTRVLASDGGIADAAIPPEHQDAAHEALQPGMSESVRLQADGKNSLLVLQQIPQFDALDQPMDHTQGVLVAELALDVVLASEQQAILQSLGTSGALLLADTQGRVLLDSSSAASNARNRFVAQQLQVGAETSRVLHTPDGEELIATFRYMHLGGADTLSLVAVRTTKDALHAIRSSFWRIGVLAALIFVAVLALFLYATHRVAQGQAQILALNAGLEDRILARTQELGASNVRLQQALEKLERTQVELVRSEKFAALGALVAGVSHELNTPLGNSLLAASTMDEQTAEATQQLARGIKRSELDAYLGHMREGTTILLSSLHRSADLVSSFKQVAADQTSVQRRVYLLDKVLDEILLTLGPSIRKSGHQVQAHIPPRVTLDSFPGPLGQVIANLVNNALLHAFTPQRVGLVSISAELHPCEVELQVRDDGCGIRPEHLGRIFDPFFTTRLGQGGSGLGLSIVYNLVTEILGGRIAVDSVWGQGTCFTLHLPLSAPQNQSKST